MMDKKERLKRSLLIIIIIVIAVVSMIASRDRRLRKAKEKEEIVQKDGYDLTGNYNVDVIKKFHEVSNDKNYLISPYNIELALNMLRDGADGKTKEEIDKLIGNRVINNLSVKDKVGIANGVFIKNEYKNNVKEDYYNILKTKYNSDIIYDEFKSPDKINNWVNEKTNGMIPKILNQISGDYVMGLASALAIDVKWQSSFECNKTVSEQFAKLNKEKIDVEMMHKTYENHAKYFKNDDATGVVIPYGKENGSNVELEFVGILPNDSIDNYIKGLTREKIENIDKNSEIASDKLHINLSLPRFKYDYEPTDFIKILNNLGINEAFNPDKANFSKMIEIPNYNVYVGEAIHKTHIELNEEGTKAAAITYFGMYKNSAVMEPEDYKTINIEFNKPFMYIIREKNTSEILFFGSVYEPNKWEKTTCENQ